MNENKEIYLPLKKRQSEITLYLKKDSIFLSNQYIFSLLGCTRQNQNEIQDFQINNEEHLKQKKDFKRSLSTCTLANCDVCDPSDSTKCKTCKGGYTYDPFTFRCQCRFMNCLICGLDASNNPTCLKCEDDYNFKNNECAYICKLNNCKACTANSSVCSECNYNYTYNKDTQLCECNAANCAECSKSSLGECVKCVTGYTLNASKTCDCTTKNCKTCNKADGTICDVCKTNYNYIETLKQCQPAVPFCKFMNMSNKSLCDTCQDNYVLNASKTACDCKFKSCVDCLADASGVCKQCFNGYSWDASSKTCKCTQTNCQVCDSYDGTVCKTCNTGLELTTDKKCAVKCEVVDCKKCIATDGKICEECTNPTNFNLVGGKCICQISKCNKCSQTQANVCDVCEDGHSYSPVELKCNCSILNCQECGTFNSVTGFTNCNKCNSGYIHPNNSQLNKCIRDCSSISNCINCTDDLQTCTQCSLNHSYDPAVKNCRCSLDSCIKCSTITTDQCDQCVTGYTPTNGKCNCSVSNCKTCNAIDGSICDNCDVGFQLNASKNKCEIQCNIANCIECETNSSSLCKKCGLNLVFDGTNCVCSIPNCSICDENNIGVCQTCINNNFTLNNGQCQCNLLKCAKCSTKDLKVCDQCENGYMFDTPSKQCICQIKNCDQCSIDSSTNNQYCDTCKTGYALTFTKICERDCSSIDKCLKCTDDLSACTQCAINHSFDSTTKSCICNLPDFKQKICTQCSSTKVDTCETCTKNYQNDNGVCKCQVDKCSSCSLNDGLICETCNSGYNLTSLKSCERDCSSLQQCLKCSDDLQTCTQCAINHQFDTPSKSCVCDLPDFQKNICTKCSTTQLNVCEQCNSNYLIESGNCKCQVNNCQACSNTDGLICSICESGYEWSAIEKKCKISIKDCIQLDSSNPQICKKCVKEKQVFNALTKQCECSIDHCIDCNANPLGECIQCTQGFKSQLGKCICSDQNCEQCSQTDGNVCNKCNPDFEITSYSNNLCIQVCKISNCEQCLPTNGNICQKCIYNFKLESGNCQCDISNCSKCSSSQADICDDCQKGYIFNSSINQCQCATSNCQKCQFDGSILNQSKCTQCNSGFTLDSTTNTCLRLCNVDNCMKCQNNPNICDQCVTNYIPNSTNDKCICSIDKCLTCNPQDVGLCDKCQEGYHFDKSKMKCVCNISNCAQCEFNSSQQQVCTLCDNGFLQDSLNENCLRICVDKACLKCTNDKNICEECKHNFSVDSNKTCQCKLSNCVECSLIEISKCDKCENGYTYNTTEQKCICDIQNCDICIRQSNNTLLCSTCKPGFEFDISQNKCKRICTVQNCEDCQDNKDTCNVCKVNHTISTDKLNCTCNIPNCSICDSNSINKCNTCKMNFILSKNNESCACSVAHCSQCDDNNGSQCIQCNQGLYFNKQTNECECKLSNCKECLNNKECKVCQDGYKLDASTKQCICNIEYCIVCEPNSSKCQVCDSAHELDQLSTKCKKKECQVNNCKQCSTFDPFICDQCDNSYLLSQDAKKCSFIQPLDYSFSLSSSLQDDGYIVYIKFENDIKQKLKDQSEFTSIFNFSITNKSNYTYSYSQNDQKTIQIKIIMNDDCKQEKLNLKIIDQLFLKSNFIRKESDAIDLNIFVIVPNKVKEDTKVATTTTKVITTSILGTAFIALFLNSFFAFFAVIDVSAYIYYLMFINVRYPYNIVEFGKLFLNFQFGYIPNIFSSLLDSEYTQRTHSKFMENETDSYFLKNSGRSIFVILLIISSYLVLKLLTLIPVQKLQRYFVQKTKEVWEYNAFISVGWITYIYLVVACILQLYTYEIHDDTSYANYILLSFFSISLIALPFLLFKALYNSDNIKTDQLIQTKYLFLVANLKCAASASKNKQSYNCLKNLFKQKNKHNKISISDNQSSPQVFRPKTVSRVGLTMDSNSSPSIACLNQASTNQLSEIHKFEEEFLEEKYSLIKQMNKYSIAMQFIRKFLFALFIVTLHDYTQLQLTCVSLLNLLCAIYYFATQPYINLAENIKNGLTEVVFIIIHILVGTLKTDDKYEVEIDRIDIGWAIISLCILILSIHFISLLIFTFNLISQMIHSLRKNKKSSSIAPLPVEQENLQKQNKSEDNSPSRRLNLKRNLQLAHAQSNMSFNSHAQIMQRDNFIPESNNNDLNKKEDIDSPLKETINLGINKRGLRRPRTKFTQINTQSGQSSMNQLDFNKSQVESARNHLHSKISFDESPV